MTYAGNRVLNTNNLAAVTLLLIGVVLYYEYEKAGDNLPFFIIPVTFLVTAIQAFYFEVTEDELIVKNYMVPFLNISYKLNEITKIQFLDTGFRSTANALIKITKGGKRSIGFQAASLRTADWQEFVNHLCEKKIPVSIEASTLKSKIGIPED